MVAVACSSTDTNATTLGRCRTTETPGIARFAHRGKQDRRGTRPRRRDLATWTGTDVRTSSRLFACTSNGTTSDAGRRAHADRGEGRAMAKPACSAGMFEPHGHPTANGCRSDASQEHDPGLDGCLGGNQRASVARCLAGGDNDARGIGAGWRQGNGQRKADRGDARLLRGRSIHDTCDSNRPAEQARRRPRGRRRRLPGGCPSC